MGSLVLFFFKGTSCYILLIFVKGIVCTPILSIRVEIFPFLSYDFKRILSDSLLIKIIGTFDKN